MTWQEIRKQLPNRWLLLEARDAHSESGKRIVEDFAILEQFDDSPSAMRAYRTAHQVDPHREMYVLHTDRAEPDIQERRWLGIRVAG